MTEIAINNTEFLAKLENIRTSLFTLPTFGDPFYDFYSPKDGRENGKLYTTDFYLANVKSRSKDKGFPDEHFSHPIGQNTEKRPDIFKKFYYSVKYDFATEIGANANALFNYYPPGGFVGWHNNWNAAAHQILFTWSETGDGFFKYQDTETGDIIKLEDRPGWQARHYRFEREEEERCWHAAYTACKRITLAYKFSLDNSIILQDLIDEIEETV